MNILLIQSFLAGNEVPVYPVGLAYLKAVMPEMNVRVVDLNVEAGDRRSIYDCLSRLFLECEYDVIGISLRNIDSTNKRTVVFYYDDFIELLGFCKKHTESRIVVGGAGFSMFAEVIMETRPEIDFGVFLEGEKTFPDLLRNLNNPERVPSVYYRKNGKVQFTGHGRKPSFRDLPDPDMTAVPVGKYLAFPESIGVETKRGCPLGCLYCPYGFLNGKSYRFKDPVRIVDWLELLVQRYGLTCFTFTDSVFNVPEFHAEAILKEMIKRDLRLSWSAWFRERELNESFVGLATRAGCRNFIFSPDGFSDRILNRLNKNMSRKDIWRSIHLMSANQGCQVSYNFFKNPPGQSWMAFFQLVLFCLFAKWNMGRRIHFEFNSLRVEPHTELYRLAVSEGLIRAGDSVLNPVYYTQNKTVIIETIFNLALQCVGK